MDAANNATETDFVAALMGKWAAAVADPEGTAARAEAERAAYIARCENPAPVVRKVDGVEVETCPRCNGAGRIHAYHYHNGGVCFRCGGACVLRA